MPQKVAIVSIEEEMKKSYLEYAMSVIVGRALPDVRDGLKPVQRRILYAMYEMGLEPNKPYRKSARIVGEVLGKYHPHGDVAVYEALSRMAQDFTMRYPLIDGQGNFGSIDGDPPAAMRYTEARLTPIALEMLKDIEKNTVDFMPNFDGSGEEPVVLPSRIPNLLINGASGIAVGMATNIPPHNLTETIKACLALLENPDLELEEILKILPGPDFPTGGIVYGQEGLLNAYRTGRGIIQVRGKVRIEKGKDRYRLVITEIPYQVNKSQLVEKIAELGQTKRIEGILEVRDESDREGLRVVVEVKKDENPHLLLKQLYKLTPLESSYGIILLALVNGQPILLNLKQMLQLFLDHRREVVRRRSAFELEESERRAHILQGLLKALDLIDQIITLIKSSESPKEAKEGLISKFGFSEPQAQAILDMRLQRLTGLERDKIQEEFEEISRKILRLKEILGSEKKLDEVVAQELKEILELYGDSRRTEIQAALPLSEEEVIEEKEAVVILTSSGYIKRVSVDEYRKQTLGGRGKTSITLKEGDFVRQILVCNTADNLLFFTDKGRAYGLKVSEVPLLPISVKGKPITTLLKLGEENISSIISVKDFSKGEALFVTKWGMVKKTPLSEFKSVRYGGSLAISLKEGDQLIGVELISAETQVLIGTKLGKGILIESDEIRPMGKQAQGVKGVKLSQGDEVIGVIPIGEKGYLFLVTERGYGKLISREEISTQKRGGKGVILLKVTSQSGPLVGILFLSENREENLLLCSSEGKVLRISAKQIPVQGRYSRGVKLMKLKGDERLADITLLK
jgi:DNA gyrase subunit A